MAQVIVNSETVEKLKNVTAYVELVDETGHVIGGFTPLPYGQEPPMDEEELRRIEQQRGGRPLKEIISDWKNRP